MRMWAKANVAAAMAAVTLTVSGGGVLAFSGPALGAQDVVQEIVRVSGVDAGLCVHVGCGDGTLTAELGRNDKFLVHGWGVDPAATANARAHVQAAGLYGRVSVERGSLSRLPYADGIVNLIVADDVTGLLGGSLSMAEVERVLCPGGVAVLGQLRSGGRPLPAEGDLKPKLEAAGLKDVATVKQGGLWAMFRKPAHEKVDSWGQWRHDPGRNLYSADADVAPARQVRWIDEPLWGSDHPSRHHGMVTAGGRIFYGERDWKPGGITATWYLLARDVHNGFLLWRKPVGEAHYDQALAAAGDRVYASVEGKLACLEAATGKVLLAFEEDFVPRTIALLEDKLLVSGRNDLLYCFDAITGRLTWKSPCPRSYARVALVAGDGKVFKWTPAKEIACLALTTGKELWRINPATFPNAQGKGHLGVQMDHYARGRLFLNKSWGEKQSVYCLSAQDGKLLWTHEAELPAPFNTYALSCEEEVWVFAQKVGWNQRAEGSLWVALDPATGKEKKRWVAKGERLGRCYPARATRDYLLFGNGLYLNRHTLETIQVGGIRGPCEAGVLPSNGLEYFFPNSCMCDVNLRGVFALASGEPRVSDDGPRLERGSAAAPSAGTGPAPDDWPMYRKDSRRSNSTSATLPGELTKLWDVKVGKGPISPPTVSGDLVYVADADAFQVRAIEVSTGKERWRFTAGGVVDVPPTLHQGLCLFGSKDGWVYCLDAQKGQLVWRYRAAPAERLILAMGRLESSWPIVGGVLVQNGLAFFCAGRCGTLDGGVHLTAAEPATGKILWTRNLLKYVTADLPVGDGTAVYLFGLKFDPATGSQSRGNSPRGVLGMWGSNGRLALDHHLRYQDAAPVEKRRGFLSDQAGIAGTVLTFDGQASFAAGPSSAVTGKAAPPGEAGHFLGAKGQREWSVRLSVQVTSLALAGDTLYATVLPINRDASKKAELWSVSTADGKTLQTIALETLPAADGIAVARGRLFLVTEDGKLLAWGKQTP